MQPPRGVAPSPSTDRHLGYCHRTTADKLRTAEALEQLPELDVCQKVFDGLCWLGFKSREARRALDLCTRDGDVPLDAASLLRKALQRLGSCWGAGTPACPDGSRARAPVRTARPLRRVALEA
jgi:hypothetical protein